MTQELASRLPSGVVITATDLNQPMIDHARAKPGMADVIWRQADAMNLPFLDGSFDLIVCQFGVMFFPDKRGAFRRKPPLLRPRGRFLFDVWNDYRAMVDAPIAIAAGVAGAMLEREPLSLPARPTMTKIPSVRTLRRRASVSFRSNEFHSRLTLLPPGTPRWSPFTGR